MPPEVIKLLADMKNAAERVGRFVAGKTFDDFVSDEMLRSAVERQFENHWRSNDPAHQAR
jgi:uncharacterized protein with HEPN domain